MPPRPHCAEWVSHGLHYGRCPVRLTVRGAGLHLRRLSRCRGNREDGGQRGLWVQQEGGHSRSNRACTTSLVWCQRGYSHTAQGECACTPVKSGFHHLHGDILKGSSFLWGFNDRFLICGHFNFIDQWEHSMREWMPSVSESVCAWNWEREKLHEVVGQIWLVSSALWIS